jgi:hypothetical protein
MRRKNDKLCNLTTILFCIFCYSRLSFFSLHFTTFAQALSIIFFLITIFSSFQLLFSGKRTESIINKQSRILNTGDVSVSLISIPPSSKKCKASTKESRFIIVFFFHGTVIAQNIIINKFA